MRSLMAMLRHAGLLCLLLAAALVAGKGRVGQQSVRVVELRAIQEAPQNVAVYVGETVRMRCIVDRAPPASRVMWGELIGGNGNLISDNENLLSHPNRDRYSIIHEADNEFHLEIRDIRQSDGGPYICQDTLALLPAKTRGIADLVVLYQPICTNLVPIGGNVIEGQTFTIECVVNYQGSYAPTMTWTGPQPFESLSSKTPSSVWAGILFTVNRTMDLQSFECLTNFTDLGDDELGVDVADNLPTWNHTYTAERLSVSWGPSDIAATPIKSSYEVGEVITCTADARPPASFQWQNMRTQNIYLTPTYTITEDMRGYTDQLRCQAQNLIQGGIYSRNLFIDVYVPPLTTPTTPTTTTPTTTPIPVSNCDSLTGRWRSDDPYAEAILHVVPGDQMGRVEGLMMNRSDTFWVEVIGTTRVQDFAYIGLSAIWPYDSGVTSISGECHKCYGVEVLHVDGMWKSIHASPDCGQVAPQTTYPSHGFRRINSLAAALEEPLRVWQPSKVSKRLGVTLKK